MLYDSKKNKIDILNFKNSFDRNDSNLYAIQVQEYQNRRSYSGIAIFRGSEIKPNGNKKEKNKKEENKKEENKKEEDKKEEDSNKSLDKSFEQVHFVTNGVMNIQRCGKVSSELLWLLVLVLSLHESLPWHCR